MSTVSYTFYLANVDANIYFLCRFDQVRFQLTFFCLINLSNCGFSGFAAEAPVSALQTLSTQDAQYKPNIEEDKVVSAYGDYAAAV